MGASKKEIRELRKRHGDIFDGKETYGEGERQAQARHFWLDVLAQPIIEQAREKLEQAGPLPRVSLLVSVAGFSPETTIITAGVFRPAQVLVISSGEPYGHIDIIGEFLIKGGLRQSQFHHERCSASDLSIFETICRRVKEFGEQRAREGKPAPEGETLIDITGGKKVMSAGAAVAGWELELRVCYIDNEYDQSRRTATPGTEKIVLLDSPFLLFGVGEQRRADHDFDLGAYEIARTRYEKLAERLNEPTRVRFLRDLSAFYEAWRNLDIERLKIVIPTVRDRLAQPGPLARSHGAKIEAQLAFVERLIAEERPARIMTLFLLGEANMEAGRYDFSALLFYRTIEASIASRLEHRFPGFECEAPDYAKIAPEIEGLRVRFEKLAQEVFGSREAIPLPRAVGCLDGAILLQVQGDPLLGQANFGSAKALTHLRNLTTARNRSILAHGYRSVTEKDCKELRAPAEQMLSAYWTLNEEPVPFKKALQNLRFVKIAP